MIDENCHLSLTITEEAQLWKDCGRAMGAEDMKPTEDLQLVIDSRCGSGPCSGTLPVFY